MKLVGGIPTPERGDRVSIEGGGHGAWIVNSVHRNGTVNLIAVPDPDGTGGGATLRCQVSDVTLAELTSPGDPRYRTGDMPTARAAADAQTPEKLSKSRRAALTALANAGATGLTDFELAERTGYAATSIGGRRKDLRNWGWVVDTGTTRLSPSQAPATVWAITTAGIDAYRRVLTDGKGAA